MGNHTEVESKKSGFATASLVLSIIAIVCSWIPLVNNLAFILGILAIIFSIVSLAKKASKGMAIAGIIIAIVACIIVYQSQVALGEAIDDAFSDLNTTFSDIDGSNTDSILENYVDVELGTLKVTKGAYSTDTSLTVKVTNKAEEKKTFSIHVEAIDSDGNRIDEDYVYANDLGAGQSQSFDIFTYISADNLSAMKSATFNIVEVSMY